MKVVIAEEDPRQRSLITEAAVELGMEPVLAHDGDEILERVGFCDCSIVLMGRTAPGTDCKEVCREIRRRDSEGEHVCYIIVSSSGGDSEDLISSLRAGADDYVRKDADLAELRARISVAARTASLEKRLIDLNNRLKFLVRTDSLTGLLNHAAILKELNMELDRASRDGSSTSILMIDIDRFKLVNDTFGHQTGDRALVSFANLLCQSCRSFDRIGRYGGEEFLLILPRTTEEESVSIGERIREGAEELQLDEDMPNLKITCSVGCCTAEISDKHPSSMVASADSALFRAKEAGRNRVMCCK